MSMKPKQPLPPDLLGEEVQKIGQALVDGSDLAVALIASSFLDECLRSLLAAHFRPGKTSSDLLQSGRGELGTYAARTDLAYSLRLIDKHALKALQTIGRIRNAFAHSYSDASFEHEEIAPLCSQLDYTYEIFVKQGYGSGDPTSTQANLDKFFVERRNQFTYTCVVLGQTLIVAAQKTGVDTLGREKL
jgi:DNA-binding MltR family transcriptional regulator